MLSLYLEPYETEPGKTERRVKIVGGEKRSAEERVSSFYAVALYKYLYEKTEDQAAWKQFKEEYLEIPYYVNLYRIQGRTTGGGKQKVHRTIYSAMGSTDAGIPAGRTKKRCKIRLF